MLQCVAGSKPVGSVKDTDNVVCTDGNFFSRRALFTTLHGCKGVVSILLLSVCCCFPVCCLSVCYCLLSLAHSHTHARTHTHTHTRARARAQPHRVSDGGGGGEADEREGGEMTHKNKINDNRRKKD